MLELTPTVLRQFLTAELGLEAAGDEEDEVVPVVVAGAGVAVPAGHQLREISLEALTGGILAHILGTELISTDCSGLPWGIERGSSL